MVRQPRGCHHWVRHQGQAEGADEVVGDLRDVGPGAQVVAQVERGDVRGLVAGGGGRRGLVGLHLPPQAVLYLQLLQKDLRRDPRGGSSESQRCWHRYPTNLLVQFPEGFRTPHQANIRLDLHLIMCWSTFEMLHTMKDHQLRQQRQR